MNVIVPHLRTALELAQLALSSVKHKEHALTKDGSLIVEGYLEALSDMWNTLLPFEAYDFMPRDKKALKALVAQLKERLDG
jgi:hypothetical protein